jgi:hypothetical protein
LRFASSQFVPERPKDPVIMPLLSGLHNPQVDLLPESGAVNDEVRTQVWGLLSTLYPKPSIVERRRETRYPFPFLIHLTPVGEDGETPCGEAVVVVGKHVSERGLGFFHPQPLPYRRMIASLEGPRGDPFAFLIDVSWCRFTRKGWYESGGRILECANPPADLQ